MTDAAAPAAAHHRAAAEGGSGAGEAPSDPGPPPQHATLFCAHAPRSLEEAGRSVKIDDAVYCPSCGFKNVDGARFCSGCGAPIAPSAAPASRDATGASTDVGSHPGPEPRFAENAPPFAAESPFGSGPRSASDPHVAREARFTPRPRVASDQRPRRVAGPQVAIVVCPHCGQRTTPVAYFARGVNIAKAAVLFPLSFIGPAVFFFFRKDRFICSACAGLLPYEAPVRMLDAFSSDTTLAADGAASEQQLVRAEIAFLEGRGLRNRARAWALGAVGAGMLTIGGAAAIGGDADALPVFATSGAIVGAGAAAASRRSNRLLGEAASKRDRQERLQLLALAKQSEGRLTVTGVAGALGCDFEEAEAMLDRLADGRRVDIQTDADGRITYVFTELARALPPAP